MLEVQRVETEVLGKINPVISSIDRIDNAIHNESVLSGLKPIETIGLQLPDTLSKIEAIRGPKVRVSSICLECMFGSNLDPNILIELHPGRPKIPMTCTKCSGSTILTNILLEVSDDLAPLFFENRIQEFILGYSLAKSSKFDRLYIHKLVSPIVNGKEKPSREIDIFAITNDGRGIAVEVTTTSRESRVPEKASKKRDSLSSIPIQRLFYVSADPTIAESETHSSDVTVLGTKQIANICEEIEYFLS